MDLVQQKEIPQCAEFVGVSIGSDEFSDVAIINHHDISRMSDGLFVVTYQSSQRWRTVGELLDQYDYFLFASVD